MKYVFIILFNLIYIFTQAQGVINSKIWPDTLSKECTLVIQNFDDVPSYHYFKKSTSTYLNRGDYNISYYYDNKLIHSEWIHISKNYTLIKKLIFVDPLPLTKVSFDPKTNNLFIDLKPIYINR